jgi:hypothetical protein
MTEKIHACFVSYRHPARPGGLEEKLLRHVVDAIQDHIELYTHKHEVYVDRPRLVPGYQYDERLAQAICRSACMVVVYWPSYLESDYCLKEIRTMLEIERKRRSVLGNDLHGCRLFIPVILRGTVQDLPSDLHLGCQYLDYKAQAIRPNFNIGDDETMSAQLDAIAEYVKSLCDKMKTVEDVLFKDCDTFTFPQNISAATGNLSVPATQPFPGRQ